MSEVNFHSLENQKPGSSKLLVNLLLIVIVAVAGIGTGYLGSKLITKSPSTTLSKTSNQSGTEAASGKAGQKNLKLFPDLAEGTLKKGGIDGEGTHHLVRKGGKDQYVYLTSSVVDLDQYQNKKVKVWGKTYSAQTAGWLMDVGYLELK
jgi:uncharacterized protein (UPF0333 family)